MLLLIKESIKTSDGKFFKRIPVELVFLNEQDEVINKMIIIAIKSILFKVSFTTNFFF